MCVSSKPFSVDLKQSFFDIGNAVTEEAFLHSHLQQNGKKVVKKPKQPLLNETSDIWTNSIPPMGCTLNEPKEIKKNVFWRM